MYDDIIEALDVVTRREDGEQCLQLISTICELMREEMTGRNGSSEYVRSFKCGRLGVSVRYSPLVR